MGKGNNTSTSTSTSSADPQAAQLYRDLLTRAQGVASTPYQAYTGQLSADQNAQQNLGQSGVNAAAGYANPYIQNASGLAAASTAPITGSTIQQYQNPYTQQVVDATTAQMRNDFGQQHASLTGNQIAQGALGGNATGVARGILSGQQGRTMASTVAGLYDNSYKQALAAAQQQQQTGLAGANAQAQYGLQGQSAALQTGLAQYGLGQGQQQTDQAALDRLYGQYQQQQAYPYQQAQWLAGMGTGVGSQLGGTSSGTSTGPQPNSAGQWLGAGLSVASMFLSDERAKEDIEHIGSLNDGQKIYRYRYKGQPGVHIGLIAQEAEQHNPDSVHRGLGGVRFVDMDEATEGAVRRADGGAVMGDYDPPGLAAGDMFAQSSPWQMRPSGNGQVSVINIRTGQVIYTGTASGAAHAQANAPRTRAAGGGIAASPWSGGLGWIPQMQIHPGQGAPRGSAPGQSQDKGGGGMDPEKMAKGLGSVGKGLWDKFGPTPDYGQSSNVDIGGYSMPQFGGGVNSSPFYGPGFAAGGGVGLDPRFYDQSEFNPMDEQAADIYGQSQINPMDERAAGVEDQSQYNFLDQQANPDPFGDTNRIIAHDNVRRGDGIIAPPELPVFDEAGTMMGNQTSAQGQPPVPPDAPMVAQDDADQPAPAVGPSDASARSRGLGRASYAPEDSYYDQPDAVRAPEGRKGFGLGLLSPNAQHGMLTAGLGMLASRSPFLGNVVGEGGLAGARAYSNAEDKDREIAAEADKLSREMREKQQKFGLDVRRVGETERHNKAMEAKERSGGDKLPPGMRIGASGQAEVIPGVEDGLRKISAARRPAPGEMLSDEDAAFLADRVAAGDTKALVGLGRGAQGAQNLIKVNRMIREKAERGDPVSGAAREILQNAAQQQGLIAAERTQANIMAKLSVYGRTAFNATDIAERLSAEVPRTSFMPVNKIINAGREKTGDPKIVALGQALMTLTNEYARAIGGGHGTVHDKEAAEKRLSAAQSHEQLKAVMDVMRQEILAEEKAMPAARQHMRDIYNPKPGGGVRSIAGEHGQASPSGPVTGASGIPAPPASQREIGKTYDTPKGPLKWLGNGQWARP